MVALLGGLGVVLLLAPLLLEPPAALRSGDRRLSVPPVVVMVVRLLLAHSMPDSTATWERKKRRGKLRSRDQFRPAGSSISRVEGMAGFT